MESKLCVCVCVCVCLCVRMMCVCECTCVVPHGKDIANTKAPGFPEQNKGQSDLPASRG